MTGPVYPPVASSGFNVWQTVISQYANSPRITALLQNFNDAIDPTANLDAFYNDIWNIDTASGAGLDLWGRILGVGRVLSLASIGNFGFAEANQIGFGEFPFYSGTPITNNYELSDDAYRLLLLVKAATNITDGSIPAINAALMALFPGRGNAYVREIGAQGGYFSFGEALFATGFGAEPFYEGAPLQNMQLEYVFNFVLQPFELVIVTSSGVVPKPSGVKALIVSQ